jgi:plastocyanin
MKDANKPLVFTTAIIGAVILVAMTVLGARAFANTQIHKGTVPDKYCESQQKTIYKVVIKNNIAAPSNTTARQCDTLTITNLDSGEREIAFGLHKNHVPYDGIAEKLVGKGQSLTVTLVQTGNFRFHDHIHDEVEGTFTVIKR